MKSNSHSFVRACALAWALFTFSSSSAAAELWCADVFPGGLQSHSPTGTVEFKRDAQLLEDPDGLIETVTLRELKSSALASCGDRACVAKGTPTPALDAGPFQASAGNTQLRLGKNESGVLGEGGVRDYGQVSVASGGRLTVAGDAGVAYRIRDLHVTDGTVVLTPGDYWIEQVHLDNATISVSGAGSARLFVAKQFNSVKGSVINAPAPGADGDPNDLVIYGYGQFKIDGATTLSALVYAADHAWVSGGSRLFGTLAAAQVTVGQDSRVVYGAGALSGADFRGLCETAFTVRISAPETLTTVGASPVRVAGSINDTTAILTLNGAEVPHANGRFEADVTLEQGLNTIVARGVNGEGEVVTASVSIYLDMTPPYITIDSPLEGQRLHEAAIPVSGLVNDIVRGTVSEAQANVVVNGVQATVANRSYLAEGVTLVEGDNEITVSASDEVGNTSTTTVTVRYEPVNGKRIERVSGQNQRAEIRTALPAPLVARLVDAAGAPVVGQPVVFRVVQGDGVVGVGTPDESQAVLVRTDEQGLVSTTFRVGSRSGNGNQKVRARAVGFAGEVVFYASADPKAGNKVSVNSGNNQRAGTGQPLPQPFVVAVTDEGSNVIEGAEVEFRVTQGGGLFQNGEAVIRALTDSDGRATAHLTLGAEAGLDFHRATATLVGTTISAGFTASALVAGDPGATAISGVVMDNQDNPLPGVTIRVDHSNRQAVTDAEGRFTITEAPVGPVHLIVDGDTTTRAGEWPTLSYNLVTVAGAENPLPAPIYLVPLDTENAVMVGHEDVAYTLPQIPGFKLTVKAGSATFPDGSRSGQISVTAVNASKVPMPPPNGMQPQFIVTIQPTGTRFDPPAPLSLPNVDGHPAGAQVEMYSYDHDLEEFVAIGLGTVSADGSVIESNPGVGVVKAGWHCGSQPNEQGCCGGGGGGGGCPTCKKPSSQDCQDGNCVADDSQDPGECQKCSGGSPAPDDSEVPTSIDDEPGDCKKPACRGGTARQVEDDTDAPDQSECYSKSADGELKKATELLTAALSKIPYVSDPSVSGAISGEVCPACCGGDKLIIGKIRYSGSVSAAATISKTLGVDFGPYETSFDNPFNGDTYIFQSQLNLGPTASATPTLSAGAGGSHDLCAGENCFTLNGCGAVSVTAGIVATAEVEALKNGREWVTIGIDASGTASGTAAAKVAHDTCGATTTEGCLGDITGDVLVEAFGFEVLNISDYVILPGDGTCAC